MKDYTTKIKSYKTYKTGYKTLYDERLHDKDKIIQNLQDRIQKFVYEVKGGAWQTGAHNSKMPHDKSSRHDTNVTPSPLVSSDNNSQLENTRLKEQSHIISSNHSIPPSEMQTKVSNSSSSTTSTTENNIYDKTTENVHTDNNNLGSSESGKYENMIY